MLSAHRANAHRNPTFRTTTVAAYTASRPALTLTTVKPLIVDFEPLDEGADGPRWMASYDFVLPPSA